jgi:hypothetical protein
LQRHNRSVHGLCELYISGRSQYDESDVLWHLIVGCVVPATMECLVSRLPVMFRRFLNHTCQSYGFASADVQAMMDSMSDCRSSHFPGSPSSCDAAIPGVFMWTTPSGDRIPVTPSCNADDPTDRQFGHPCVEAFTHGDRTFYVYYPLASHSDAVTSLYGCY